MHELAPQVLERLATRIVAFALSPRLMAADGRTPTLDLSSEVELAELFRSVTTTSELSPAEISSAGPARIVADVNHRLDRTLTPTLSRTRTRTRT